MLKDFSVQALFMGLLTAFVGSASSFAVVLHGLQAVGATDAQAASGLMALSISGSRSRNAAEKRVSTSLARFRFDVADIHISSRRERSAPIGGQARDPETSKPVFGKRSGARIESGIGPAIAY